MPRSWPIWLIFVVSTAAVIAALGWVSRETLKLDRAEAVARAQATREEAVRLALWRMDSNVAGLLAVESSRTYFDYSSFYSAARAYGELFASNSADEPLIPSPLLAAPEPPIRLHFQLSSGGEWTSPQAPRDARLALALRRNLIDQADVEQAEANLADLAGRVFYTPLAARLPLNEPAPLVAMQLDDLPQQVGNFQVAQSPQYQQRLNINELEARQRVVQQQKESPLNRYIQSEDLTPLVQVGPFHAVWESGELLLVRRVVLGGEDFVQGSWLDWPALQARLQNAIEDVLPLARLAPLIDNSADPAERRLATLPVRLDLAGLPLEVPPGATPLQLSLSIAWICVVLAIGAVGALLAGALALSERRAAFVSAVTHELRTPLTTFRLYTEMLAGGRVREAEQQQSYFRTLDEEAQRLTHLVDNVLAYARLERGRRSAAAPLAPLRTLLERIVPRLVQRAERSQQSLQLELDPRAAECPVAADPALVEQILLNLVDNACKYGATNGAAIQVSVGVGPAPDSPEDPLDPSVHIAVRDAGPGIPPAEARRLFRAFHKSARDAAHSAPGVGLGLALSRRLARSLGGDLRLAADGRPGACFVLMLPADRRK